MMIVMMGFVLLTAKNNQISQVSMMFRCSSGRKNGIRIEHRRVRIVETAIKVLQRVYIEMASRHLRKREHLIILLPYRLTRCNDSLMT